MAEHELLHLAIVRAAPVRAGQEGPADFNFALVLVVGVKSRRANDSAGFVVDGEERAAGVEGILEEFLEDVLLIAVGTGMLFPDEGIASNGEKIVG